MRTAAWFAGAASITDPQRYDTFNNMQQMSAPQRYCAEQVEFVSEDFDFDWDDDGVDLAALLSLLASGTCP